jgi:hypothetical protein
MCGGKILENPQMENVMPPLARNVINMSMDDLLILKGSTHHQIDQFIEF